MHEVRIFVNFAFACIFVEFDCVRAQRTNAFSDPSQLVNKNRTHSLTVM